MSERPIIVFDVNETLLDLDAIRPVFDRAFSDPAAMRLWFAGLITYSEALTLADVYVPCDALARLAEAAGTGEPPGPDWALAAGQHVQRQLAGLEQARSAALQVVSLAPRRWPERSRVRRAGEQTAPLDLLAATVLGLAHASTTEFAAEQPHSGALRAALAELTLAFAALADGGDADGSRAALHATRVRMVLAIHAAQLRGVGRAAHRQARRDLRRRHVAPYGRNHSGADRIPGNRQHPSVRN
jgi:hypothetical protein